jgi:hypothetical protein
VRDIKVQGGQCTLKTYFFPLRPLRPIHTSVHISVFDLKNFISQIDFDAFINGMYMFVFSSSSYFPTIISSVGEKKNKIKIEATRNKKFFANFLLVDAQIVRDHHQFNFSSFLSLILHL